MRTGYWARPAKRKVFSLTLLLAGGINSKYYFEFVLVVRIKIGLCAPEKSKETRTAYHAHRERQRRRILDAAGQLFDDRGIDRVTMAEITLASGVQPSTMYQYFRNKDDIVWAILEEVLQERSRVAKESLELHRTRWLASQLFWTRWRMNSRTTR